MSDYIKHVKKDFAFSNESMPGLLVGMTMRNIQEGREANKQAHSNHLLHINLSLSMCK